MSIAEKFEIVADAVYEKGKQAEYDRFWDAYQENGNKRFYGYAFAYWNDEVFKPKYTILTDSSTNRTNFMFGYAKMTEVMTPMYFYETGQCNSTFYYMSNCIKIGDDTGGGIWVTRGRPYTSNFNNCKKLEEIRFIDYNEKGEYVPSEIGNSISFSDSPLLSVESQINIIKHLVDFSGTDDAGTRILTIHPTAWETFNQTYSSPFEVGIDFDGSWISYVESLGWSM